MIRESKINITAHAGCMGTRMDSIEAIEVGIKYGADIIEIDLNIDGDGNLVLCHDKPKRGIEYPSFEEALEIMKKEQGVILNIDIKDVKVLEKLNRTIFQYGVKDRFFFTGLNFLQIKDNVEKLRGCKYFINLESPRLDIAQLNNKEYLRELLKDIAKLNVMGININYKLLTPEIVSVCKEKRMLSSLWTVDDMEEMRKFINLKVNSITTKRVDILKSLLESTNNS